MSRFTLSRVALSAMALIATVVANAMSPTFTPANGYPRFALGADISWTPYIEENHLHTYYKGYTVDNAQITNVADMVYDHGIDAVRLRVWVNPKSEVAMAGFTFKADGYTYDEMSTFGTCSVEEMTALARRFAMQGQRVMVTFQLSDTWADPGRQFIPGAWADCTTTQQLSDRVCAHITDALTLLHDANVNVAWVQIGNEVNNGMLKWQMPTTTTGTINVIPVSYGCAISQKSPNTPSETTRNFVKVFSDAARAAKKIYPETKTVLHLTKTAEWNTVNWTLNLLDRAGISAEVCDYIGLSLYPGIDDGQEDYTGKWQTYADRGITTINNIYNTYGYRTLLCEMGMNNEYSLSANTTGVPSADLQQCYITRCNEDVRAFTQYLIEKLDTDNSTCDGLFYWEPETDYMKGYKKGACVSITPGASWPRSKITANDWWLAVKAHSTFPDGGLVEYQVGEGGNQGFEPDPNLKLNLYYYTDQDNYVALTSADGLLYKLTGFAAAQWFNFKIVNDDWSIAFGNAEIGVGQEGFLNNRNDWFAWTSTTVSASDYWWYRQDTHAMTITATDECPWTDIAGIESVTTDNTPVVYYNMQGVRVDNPGCGVYIKRQGNMSSKVIIR